MTDVSSWNRDYHRLPLILSVIVGNQEDSIYESLCSTIKVAHVTIAMLDNSNDKSASEMDRFLRRQRPNNFFIFDTTSQDPWPNYQDRSEHVIRAKSYFKSLQLAKGIVNNGIWLAIDPSLILCENAQRDIYDSAAIWKNPAVDYSILKASNDSTSFVPLTWLKGSLFPGPDSFHTNQLMYAQVEGKIHALKSSYSSKNIGITRKDYRL